MNLPTPQPASEAISARPAISISGHAAGAASFARAYWEHIMDHRGIDAPASAIPDGPQASAFGITAALAECLRRQIWIERHRELAERDERLRKEGMKGFHG